MREITAKSIGYKVLATEKSQIQHKQDDFGELKLVDCMCELSVSGQRTLASGFLLVALFIQALG